ncbi:aldehyde dehydrogenase family protein [Streptomyces sp. NPDC006925]|uniref:aldehyde dehydrogenase family protein n=1 Tax=Streptomyces sp. NPDC006925 TaxID=3364768 RepID=UPI0036A50DC8
MFDALHPGLFVGGRWIGLDSRIPVGNPATAETVGSVPAGGKEHVDLAVAAARTAFGHWSCTGPGERAEALERLADTVAAREAEFARTITAEMGAPHDFSLQVQVRLAVDVLRAQAALARTFPFSESLPDGPPARVLREPAGVVAAITPWNYPLYQITAKLGAALAVGCAVVLKPSGVAPLNAYLLADCAQQAGLPAGLFNVVSGSGRTVGEALAAHPGVDVVSFTGSTGAGQHVMRTAAGTVKRVALELGGKSAAVALPDADLAAAVGATVASAFANTGQTCTALARLLVPAERYADAVDAAVSAGSRYTLGDPTEPGGHLGPSASPEQRDTVLEYIRLGVEEGARVVLGGLEAPDGIPAGLAGGHWVRPTVLADAKPSMRVVREEIFGPVLCLLPYVDEAEAVLLANDCDYGLSGAVWSADTDRAVAFARRMRTGRVEINGGAFNLNAPSGGYKLSGLGRELGRWGLEEFCETKTLQGVR